MPRPLLQILTSDLTASASDLLLTLKHPQGAELAQAQRALGERTPTRHMILRLTVIAYSRSSEG
ncbi:MAG: hypothetical protein ACRDS9_00095 [Pseudonocardiaceae bacterium]